MSKYVDGLKSSYPEHLYIFDLSRSELDGGTVTDSGYGGVDAAVVEDTGFAEVESTFPLVEGLAYSNHPNVIHDAGANIAGNYASYFTVAGEGTKFFGPDAIDAWSVELVVRPKNFNRSRDHSKASLFVVEQGTTAEGIEAVFDLTTTPATVQFRITQDYTEESDKVIATTSELATNSTYHLVVVKSGQTYAIYVDRVLQDTATVLADSFTPTALNSTTLYIGGYDSRYHADTTLQVVTTYDRILTPNEIGDRYAILNPASQYERVIAESAPQVVLYTDDLVVEGVSEPSVHGISTGTNSDELYENENQELLLQPSVLGAGAVTHSKKLKFDLSELTAGVSTFLDITATTDANSNVATAYSFDDVAYSVFAEGTDTITELDANWGGVV